MLDGMIRTGTRRIGRPTGKVHVLAKDRLTCRRFIAFSRSLLTRPAPLSRAPTFFCGNTGTRLSIEFASPQNPWRFALRRLRSYCALAGGPMTEGVRAITL
jgi:hypothetical protein